jgi:hypothetical protein
MNKKLDIPEAPFPIEFNRHYWAVDLRFNGGNKRDLTVERCCLDYQIINQHECCLVFHGFNARYIVRNKDYSTMHLDGYVNDIFRIYPTHEDADFAVDAERERIVMDRRPNAQKQ